MELVGEWEKVTLQRGTNPPLLGFPAPKVRQFPE